MGKLSEILDGWGNLVKSNFGLLDEETRKLAESRLLHCNACSIRTDNTCDPNKMILNQKTNQWISGINESLILISSVLKKGYYTTEEREVLNLLRKSWIEEKNASYKV